MAAIDLGDVEDFPFLDPPDRRQVRDGIALLQELGALDESGRKLTPLGRKLAQLPVDPRMGRMVLEADRLGCTDEVIVIAAALSIQDVRERPADQQAQADQAHARHADESSDFLAYLNLWRYLHERRGELSVNQFRKQAKGEFLHYLRIREWQDLVGQIRQAAKERRHQDQPHARRARGDPPGDPDRPALAPRAARRRPARLSRRARRALRAVAGQRDQGPAELGDGRRAGRDVAAVGPDGGEDRPALGRAAGRAPGPAHLRGAALGPQARVGRRHRARHALRAADRRRPRGRLRPARPGRSRATCSSAARWSRASGTRATASSPPTSSWSRRSRRSRSARAGATSSSTTRRCTTSTPPGSPSTIVSGAHFDRWWRDERRVRPDLLTFTRELLINPAAAEDVARAAGHLAPGRARAQAHLPLRARQRARRRDRPRAAEDAPAAALRGLRVARARRCAPSSSPR